MGGVSLGKVCACGFWGVSVCLQISCEVLMEGAQGCSCAAPVHHHPAGLRDSLADVGLLINWGSGLACPRTGVQQGPEEHPNMGEEDEQSPSMGKFWRAPEFTLAMWDFPMLNHRRSPR